MSEAEQAPPEGNGATPSGADPRAVQAVAQEHGIESKEFLESVTDYDKLEPRVAKIAGNVLSRKHSVTNYTPKDVWELRYLIKIDFRRARAQYPPPESCMQGALRKYVYGDNKRPLTEHEKNQLKNVERSLLATLRQSEGGWLLDEIIAKVKQESKQVAERVDNTQSNDSVLDRIMP